jgi:hypothetical protein
MSGGLLTLIDEGRRAEIRARVADGRVLLTPAALEQALGWKLEVRGLCRGDTCIPVRRFADRVNGDGVDLAAFAELVGRPLALDAEAGAAVLGTSAGERQEQLASLEAPDFSLPDLEGTPHALSAQRGKKVLLVTWASW